MSSLKDRYKTEVTKQLREALGLSNPMRIPRLNKVVVNMGLKATDKEVLNELVKDVSMITGQKAMVTKSRKSISNFKLRAGMPIGIKVTLRGARMFDFLERLIHAALPRIRDFRGLPAKGFDGRGNYNFGVEEQTVFPEIDPDTVKKPHGMNITIVTTARDDREAKELLTRLGVPLSTES